MIDRGTLEELTRADYAGRELRVVDAVRVELALKAETVPSVISVVTAEEIARVKVERRQVSEGLQHPAALWLTDADEPGKASLRTVNAVDYVCVVISACC